MIRFHVLKKKTKNNDLWITEPKYYIHAKLKAKTVSLGMFLLQLGGIVNGPNKKRISKPFAGLIKSSHDAGLARGLYVGQACLTCIKSASDCWTVLRSRHKICKTMFKRDSNSRHVERREFNLLQVLCCCLQ